MYGPGASSSHGHQQHCERVVQCVTQAVDWTARISGACHDGHDGPQAKLSNSHIAGQQCMYISSPGLWYVQ